MQNPDSDSILEKIGISISILKIVTALLISESYMSSSKDVLQSK